MDGGDARRSRAGALAGRRQNSYSSSEMSARAHGVVMVLADSFGWHDGDVGVGWWIVMMLGMVVFWGAVVFGVVWLVRGASSPRAAAESPLEILRRRLAQGEISPEEFEQRRALLDADGGSGDRSREGPG